MSAATTEKFIAVSRHTVGRAHWDTFVDASDEAWLWHRYDLQDAIATWPGKCDHSFAVLDRRSANDQVVAVVPVHTLLQRSIGSISLHTLDSLGGIACANTLGKKERRKLLDYILQKLRILAWQHTANEIHFTLTPMAPAFRGERCPRVNPLLELGCSNTLTQTWVVDLRQSEEALQRSYAELTRRELKKVRMGEYDIREARTPEDIDIYYDLHCQTYHRTGAQPHPKAYFQAIFEQFVRVGLSRIVFFVRDGRVIAAQNSGIYKQAAIYWTGASHSEKDGGENRALFDNQISVAQRNGCEWYETGEAFPHVTEGKLKGLNDFKRSFGGTLYPIYRGTLVLSSKLQQLISVYRALRGHVPS